MRLFLTLALALLAPSLRAQCTPPANEPAVTRYMVSYTASATSSVVTIQQPASNASRQTMECAYVYCEIACTVQFSQNGTAATATALTPVSLTGGTPNITAWRSSNVGTGTAVGPAYNLTAASGQTFYLAATLTNSSTANNFSVTVTPNSTGSIQVAIQARQQPQ